MASSSPQFKHPQSSRSTTWYTGLATVVLLLATAIPLLWNRSSGLHVDLTDVSGTDDHLARAKRILRETPLVDGHNDFPYLIRQQLHNEIYGYDFEAQRLGAQSDFEKMKRGMMGGQFWSVFVPCPEDIVPPIAVNERKTRVADFNEPNWAVRDTLEQIDITKRLIAHYPNLLQYCDDPACIRRVHSQSKIAGMIGVEGGHQIGSSLGVLRLFFESGVRYMTLTHNCDNAIATSWVSVDLESGKDAGLTDFGRATVHEMNRLGMLVDLSHVSPNTMRDVLRITRAPVIFSHSGAYNLSRHLRNVPDDVLRAVAKNGGVVMVPAVSYFMNWDHPDGASVDDVIDHILHIVDVAGWNHVGLGSDFDGAVHVVRGLEDTSQWPNFLARFLARSNATDEQAKLVVGDNLIRVWTEVQRRAEVIQNSGELPCEKSWDGRIWESTDYEVPQLFPGR